MKIRLRKRKKKQGSRWGGLRLYKTAWPINNELWPNIFEIIKKGDS